MTKLAIGINLRRCIGCNTCAVACKMQNNVPDGMLWNRVLTEGCERFDSAEGTYPNLSRTYLPLACQHCENPACERVPERARGVMEKCTLCKERTDEGDEPMCVHCCPADARVFGDLDDPDSAVSRLRREQSAEVLLEEKGTRPQVFYVR